METTNIQQIEGLLFVAGDEGISLADLSTITGFDRPAIQLLIEKLAKKYSDDSESPFEIKEQELNYRLVTKTELNQVIQRFFEAPISTNLSTATLEVLAIIAYKQPITRSEIDEIRGVNSSGAVSKLLIRGLINERGRKEEAGRPILFGTSDFFLDYFGLKKIDDLSPLKEISKVAEEVAQTQNLFLKDLNSREEKLGLEPSENVEELILNKEFDEK